jgi:hypothetical protein
MVEFLILVLQEIFLLFGFARAGLLAIVVSGGSGRGLLAVR